MFKEHMIWNQEQYTYNKSLLTNRINKVYNLFDIKLSSKDLTTNIENIKNELINRYHIPSKYTDNLQVIISRIGYIENNNWSKENTKEQIDQLWNELETNTPSNLVLK